MNLEIGKQYEIIKSGASLSTDTYTGNSTWRSSSTELEVGDVVTYVGKTPGLGHDNVSQDTFETSDGTKGKFFPQSWGSADTDYLDPVEPVIESE